MNGEMGQVRTALVENLKELHLPAMRSCFEETARRAEKETLSYEQYLSELAQRECEERRRKRIGKLLKESGLPLEKSLANFDGKRLPVKVSRQMKVLLEGGFLDRKENLLITIEAWTRRGLQRFFILFFMELSTRKVEIAGIASGPSGLWMNQIGRNLTDAVDGLLKGKRYLIHDRDPLFTAEFLSLLGEAGVASVKLPPRSPNLNAHAERSVRTIKESCLERMVLFGESAVRKATAEFMAHYHSERNHQGLDNALICPELEHARGEGKVHRRERLGGLLNYYYRRAA